MTKKIKYPMAILIVMIFSYMLLFVNNKGIEVSTNNQIDSNQIAVGHAPISTESDAPINNIKNIRLARLPESLQGLDINIALPVTDNGELIVNQALRDVFELYLSALGEEPLETIISRINYHAALQLAPHALEQTLDVLDRYIAYRHELVAVQEYLNEQPESLTQLEIYKIRQEKINDIQNSFFNERENEGFFSQETIYDEYLMNHMAISQDSELSTEEKKHRLSQLELELPDDVLSTRKSATQYGDLHYEVSALEQSGATDEEIFQARLKSVGEESAAALAELDRKRAVWQQRVTDYRTYEREISTSSLSLSDQQNSVQVWLDEHFSSIEQVRVKAITAYTSQ